MLKRQNQKGVSGNHGDIAWLNRAAWGVNMNDEPIEHLTRNGTNFRCQKSDLRVTVYVTNPYSIGVAKLGADFAEFAGWHCANILPMLHGFSGYDCVNYELDVPELEK